MTPGGGTRVSDSIFIHDSNRGGVGGGGRGGVGGAAYKAEMFLGTWEKEVPPLIYRGASKGKISGNSAVARPSPRSWGLYFGGGWTPRWVFLVNCAIFSGSVNLITNFPVFRAAKFPIVWWCRWYVFPGGATNKKLNIYCSLANFFRERSWPQGK